MVERMAERIVRILGGSVNALVDAVENAAPEAVMEQAIRDVDSVMEEVRLDLGRATADRHLASSRLADLNKRHQELSQSIEEAVGLGRDDLAEAAIARQMDLEAQTPTLEKSLADLTEQEKEQEGYLSALMARRREMRGELDRFREIKAARSKEEASTAGGLTASGLEGRLRAAEGAFDRALSQGAGVGSVGHDPDTAAKLAELEALSRANRIQERLAAIKTTKASS
ncbi:MAG: PspA/IM30 family protein [Rhodospirillum sp.]|nr:PspA/IM30 family protein [Rhodospirillum sp.]MCF8492080.1 PspA/IM30 family protein [Rhodospirillum sp.]